MNSRKKSLVFIFICACLTVSFILSVPAGALDSGKTEITGRIPLVAYDISVTGIDLNTATVNWKTNAEANGTIEYGTTAAYGSFISTEIMAENHTISLFSLLPGTLYHYRLISDDLAGNHGVSGDLTFTTGSPIPTPTPTPVPTGGGGSSGSGGTSSGGNLAGPISLPGGIVDSLGQQSPVLASEVTSVTGVGELTSGPLAAEVSGMPYVIAWWTADINTAPPANAKMTTAIQQAPDQASITAFTTALNLVGKDIGNIAYVMVVQKTGIAQTGPAIITMTVSPEWVSQNGGNDAIAIVRMADDGTVEVLTTSFSGYDANTGYAIFTAPSPQGLCMFGLVGLKSYTMFGTSDLSTTRGAGPETARGTSFLGGLTIPAFISGVVVLILVVAGAGIFYYNRREVLSKERQKKK